MNLFTRLKQMIGEAIHKLIPYKQIEQAANFESPVSNEMTEALNLWAQMYQNKAPYLSESGMKSMNLASFICSELSRQVLQEMKWNITGAEKDAEGESAMNDRAVYQAEQFKRCTGTTLREKLEVGMGAGGMVVKPYPDIKSKRIFFDFVPDWSVFPVSFDGDGYMTDAIFRDSYQDGKTYYTRLERQTVEGDNVIITQNCYKSTTPDTLGKPCELTEVPTWAELEPEIILEGAGGKLPFGWFRVASSNNIDLDSCMGASVFAKAVDMIRDADEQYSRIDWEFKAKETAIDVDPTVLVQKAARDTSGRRYDMPKLNERLFRAVDLGDETTYNVFDPPIRDVSLLNGLNSILCRIEDLCGLARGTMSDTTAKEALTATQIKILKQRTYETINANQQSLEQCLRDVIAAMQFYADALELAPKGDIEVSFEWDDSVIADTDTELEQRLRLQSAGIMSKVEVRMWYLGETRKQAEEAITQISTDNINSMAAAHGIPGLLDGDAE